MPLKCPEARAAYMKRWHEQNADHVRTRNLQHRYGITLEDYEEMHESQNGACAVCYKLPDPGRLLCVDHCHETGKVRGLLCDNCNRGIGLLQDDAPTLLRAAEYLRGAS